MRGRERGGRERWAGGCSKGREEEDEEEEEEEVV